MLKIMMMSSSLIVFKNLRTLGNIIFGIREENVRGGDGDCCIPSWYKVLEKKDNNW